MQIYIYIYINIDQVKKNLVSEFKYQKFGVFFLSLFLLKLGQNILISYTFVFWTKIFIKFIKSYES